MNCVTLILRAAQIFLAVVTLGLAAYGMPLRRREELGGLFGGRCLLTESK